MKKVLFSLMIAATLTACGEKTEAPKENTKPVVKIGVIYPLNGDAVDFANSAKKAYSLFKKNIAKINTKYNYELIWEDSAMSPIKGANAAHKLINIDNVDAVLTVLSRVTKAISPITAKNKVIQLAQGVDFSVADGKYNFILTTSAEKQGKKLYEYLIKQGIKYVDIVALYDAGTVEFLNKFKNISSKLQIKNEYIINPGERDFRIMIQKIIKDQPEMIVVFGVPPEINIFMKQFKEANVNIPVSSVDAFSYIKDLNNINGYPFSTYGYPKADFVEMWRKEFNEELPRFGEDNFYTRLQLVFQVYENYDGNEKPNTNLIADLLKREVDKNIYVIRNLSIDDKGVVDSEASLCSYENGKLRIYEN